MADLISQHYEVLPMKAMTRSYRNLNTGSWTVKQKVDGKWIVTGHADSVLLKNVKPRQSEKARQRVIERQQRDVHCWVEGELIGCTGLESYKGRETLCGRANHLPPNCINHVTYNPYIHKTLVFAADSINKAGQEYTGSTFCYLTSNKHMMVSV